jgi:hypothetical protein
MLANNKPEKITNFGGVADTCNASFTVVSDISNVPMHHSAVDTSDTPIESLPVCRCL